MRMYAFTTVEGLLSQRRPHARPGRRSGATLNGLAGRSACSGRHSWHHHGMRYADREDAGDQLAAAIVRVVAGPAVVRGVARGGVIVAVPVAKALRAPLDVVVPRKVGAPFNPELGLGAVAPGVRVLDERLIARLGVSSEYLEGEIARQEAEIARRTAAYRGDRTAVELEGRTAVIVDDGVATGGTALAAARWARAQRAPTVVFGAPVGPRGTAARGRAPCDTGGVAQKRWRLSARGAASD